MYFVEKVMGRIDKEVGLNDIEVASIKSILCEEVENNVLKDVLKELNEKYTSKDGYYMSLNQTCDALCVDRLTLVNMCKNGTAPDFKRSGDTQWAKYLFSKIGVAMYICDVS